VRLVEGAPIIARGMKWISRSIIPAAVALAALVSFFPRSGPKTELHMRDFKFVPQVLNVTVGESVGIINDGNATHSFVCLLQGERGAVGRTGCGANPGDVQPGLTKVVKFARAGQYDFFCRYHSSRGMVGRLVVLEPGQQEAPPVQASPAASPSP
jgi:plastocyanin